MPVKFAVLGAGNGGQALAGYLAWLGYEVRLYDAFQEVISAINDLGGIQLEGEFPCFGRLAFASTDIARVLAGVDLIMVVNPSIFHPQIAGHCAPYLKENQVVFLHPGGTFGALAFKQALLEHDCSLDIPIAESSSLIYACRALQPGRVLIGGKKDRLLVSTLPNTANETVRSLLAGAFPDIQMARSVLVTSFDNTNPIFHPAPTLLSTSWIESGKDFLYYYEGISETIGKFIVGMDQERLAIGKAVGLEYGTEIIDVFTQYRVEYHTGGESIADVVRHVPAYAAIYGPKTLKTRYIYEDVPMGLVPLVSLGKAVGQPTEKMELIIHLAEQLLGENFSRTGRNLATLGLQGLSLAQIVRYAESGLKDL
jgi:opine dehydrogenase